MGGMIIPMLAFVLLLMGREGGVSLVPGMEPLWPLIYLGLAWIGGLAAGRERARARQESRPVRAGASQRSLDFALWAGLVLGGGWPGYVQQWVGNVPFLTLLIGFSPYAAHTYLRTLSMARQDRRDEDDPRRAAAFSLRLLGLSIVPIMFIHGMIDFVRDVEAVGRIRQIWPLLFEAALIPTLLVGTFAVSPFLVRYLLGAAPLPAGSLRDRLTAYDQRTGFRRRDVLLWNTHGLMTNAMYLGLGPRLSYVILTDALVKSLDEEAVEAVYAHEAGHGERRHLLLNVGMIVGFSLLSTVLALEVPYRVDALASLWFSPEVSGQIAVVAMIASSVGMLLAFFFIGLGWVSRRFETEADLHAVATLEGPGAFPRALKAVGLHAGMLQQRRGLRHFGIGKRIGILARFAAEPDFRNSLGRHLKRTRHLVLGFLVLAILSMVLVVPGELEIGTVRASAVAASELAEKDAEDAAFIRYQQAFDGYRALAASNPRKSAEARNELLMLLGEATNHVLFDWGRTEFARELVARMEPLEPEWTEMDRFNRDQILALVAYLEGERDPNRFEDLIKALLNRFEGLESQLGGIVGDLYLAQRAAGGSMRLPKKVGGYPPTVLLLQQYERGEVLTADDWKSLAQDFEEMGLRRILLREAVPEMVADLLSARR